MKTSTLFLSTCGMVATVLLQTTVASAQASDEAQIRALEDSFAAGIRAKDLDAIMNVYVPDQTLFVFDVVPPRQDVGPEAYRKEVQAMVRTLQDRYGLNPREHKEKTEAGLQEPEQVGFAW